MLRQRAEAVQDVRLTLPKPVVLLIQSQLMVPEVVTNGDTLTIVGGNNDATITMSYVGVGNFAITMVRTKERHIGHDKGNHTNHQWFGFTSTTQLMVFTMRLMNERMFAKQNGRVSAKLLLMTSVVNIELLKLKLMNGLRQHRLIRQIMIR